MGLNAFHLVVVVLLCGQDISGNNSTKLIFGNPQELLSLSGARGSLVG